MIPVGCFQLGMFYDSSKICCPVLQGGGENQDVSGTGELEFPGGLCVPRTALLLGLRDVVAGFCRL